MSLLGWLIVALVLIAAAVALFVVIRVQRRKGGVLATRRRPKE